MRHKAKQRGSGGRLRLGLLLATTAALLLVPAAMASANVKVIVEGSGSGTAKGIEPAPGVPPIECVHSGGAPTICESEPTVGESGPSVKLEHITASGSEFKEWKVLKGVPLGCAQENPEAGTCPVLGATIEIKAVFLKEPNVHVTIDGEGSGEVVGVEPETNEYPGTPRLECAWNGETEVQSGACDVVASTGFIFTGISAKAIPAEGSKFTGWTKEEGTDLEGCEFTEEEANFDKCTLFILGEGEIKLKATFEPIPSYTLNLSESGIGSGSFECEVESVTGACQPEYEEGTEVTVIANPNTGSTFTGFTGDCSTAPCELTMDENHSVGASYGLETRTLTVNNEGENGTVKCRFPPGSYVEPCEYNELPVPYGTEVEVVATPESGAYLLAELNGSGSASGKCSLGTGTCTFAIKANSEVEAVFAPAAIRASLEPNVEGHVEQATKLEWIGGTPQCEKEGNPNVDFGEFYLEEPEREYLVECDLNVTTTGAETTLTAKDGSEVHKGHLIQTATHWETEDPFALVKPLEMSAKSALYTPEECDESPQALDASEGVVLCDYTDPANNDTVTASFIQWIEEHERLHHGTYSKVITLTLEQIHP